MRRICPAVDGALEPVAKVRILYADTDQMGVVYHASYLRYMELGRVELIRALGIEYVAMERSGLALPVTDVAVHYRRPARYDDSMTIEVGLTDLSPVRVGFDYRLSVAGFGHEAAFVAIEARTQHACMRLSDGKPQRFPPDIYQRLAAAARERAN